MFHLHFRLKSVGYVLYLLLSTSNHTYDVFANRLLWLLLAESVLFQKFVDFLLVMPSSFATRMMSASRIVERRCATIKLVRPCIIFANAF